jgi:RimJ/RimL family protein N-acetyltransferase
MENNSLEIIELTIDSSSLLSKKLLEENKDYIKHFIPFDFSESSIKKILSEKKLDKFYGLYSQKELIGYYMLRGIDAGFEIPSYGVWISSSYANKGLSTLTLYHAFSFCKINKIKTLMLKVHPDNSTAKNLYEKLGFKQTGFDEKINNIIYHKSISL